MRIKTKNEETASGISPTRSEVEEAFEYLIEKEDASDEIHKNNMNRKDDMAEREKAEEVRKVATESLGTTKRRKEDEKKILWTANNPKEDALPEVRPWPTCGKRAKKKDRGGQKRLS